MSGARPGGQGLAGLAVPAVCRRGKVRRGESLQLKGLLTLLPQGYKVLDRLMVRFERRPWRRLSCTVAAGSRRPSGAAGRLPRSGPQRADVVSPCSPVIGRCDLAAPERRPRALTSVRGESPASMSITGEIKGLAR